MDSIFMNFENCKKFGSHSPLLNVSDKMNLREVINMLLYQILEYTLHGKT